MKKTMVFTYDEFEFLIDEVTYGLVEIYYDAFDNIWCWSEAIIDDWNEWLKEYGEETEDEVNSFGNIIDDDGFVYAMLGKRFDAVVEEIIIDLYRERVAVIFK